MLIVVVLIYFASSLLSCMTSFLAFDWLKRCCDKNSHVLSFFAATLCLKMLKVDINEVLLIWIAFVPLLSFCLAEEKYEDFVALKSFDERNFNTSKRFVLPAIGDIGYMLGCNLIQVSSLDGDFNLNIKTQRTEDFVETDNWYKVVFVVFQRIFSPKSREKVIKTHCTSPFKDTVIVVEPSHIEQVMTIQTYIKRFDIACCSCLTLGLILFYLSGRLSKSVMFYYSTGVGVGVLASMLVLVFILSRLLPKKQATYTVLLGGWSICAWIISHIWKNLTEILLQHYYVVAAYLFLAGFGSFAVCYRLGPAQDPRTHNIIQWTIQIISVILIYNGTQLPKVSLAIIFGVSTQKLLENLSTVGKVHEITRTLKQNPILRIVLGKFADSEPRRLLTEEEYLLEGERETKRALEELRGFCNSPHCSPWKTLSRLESPGRFAQFVEGDPHVQDQEVSMYEEDMQQMTDSENESDPLGNSLPTMSLMKEEYMSEDSD